MRDAFSKLHWTPDTFWRSTLTEYLEAIEGLNEGSEKDGGIQPPTEGELESLFAQFGG